MRMDLHFEFIINTRNITSDCFFIISEIICKYIFDKLIKIIKYLSLFFYMNNLQHLKWKELVMIFFNKHPMHFLELF